MVQRKVSDMSKRTAALVFAVGLLSSVAGEESFQGNNPRYDGLPFSASTFKEICLSHFNPVSCQYLDSLRYKTIDSKSPRTKTVEWNPDNRTTEEISQEQVSIEVPIVDPKNNFHKRFTVFRRKNPTGRGYKRGPGFRSWGGKRDFALSEENRVKKSKFASWGGKRDGEFFPDENEAVPDKRARFQNWGGKRIADGFGVEPEKRWPAWKGRRPYLSESFKKHVPKQFQRWGGKRGSDPWRQFFDFFHPPPRYLLNGGEKRIFSSWGGKRFDEETQFKEPHWDNFKGRVFQNWGGKRVTDGESSESIDSGKEKLKGETSAGEPRFEEAEEEDEGEEGEEDGRKNRR